MNFEIVNNQNTPFTIRAIYYISQMVILLTETSFWLINGIYPIKIKISINPTIISMAV